MHRHTHMCTHRHRHPYTQSVYIKRDVHTCFKLHVCSLETKFDCPRTLGNVEIPGDCWVPFAWLCGPGSSGNTPIPLKSPPLSCRCALVGALHTTSPQPLQCQLISTQISYSLSALSLQKLLLYTFTANKCARDYALFARSKEKANATLKVIHHRIVL